MNIDYRLLESRIGYLCNQKGVSVNKMLQEAGLTKSVIDNIKRERTPSSETILTIATYFDVTTDYLLAKSDSPKGGKGEEVPHPGSLDWFRAGLISRGIIDASEDLTDAQLTAALKTLDNLVNVLAKQKKS